MAENSVRRRPREVAGAVNIGRSREVARAGIGSRTADVA